MGAACFLLHQANRARTLMTSHLSSALESYRIHYFHSAKVCPYNVLWFQVHDHQKILLLENHSIVVLAISVCGIWCKPRRKGFCQQGGGN